MKRIGMLAIMVLIGMAGCTTRAPDTGSPTASSPESTPAESTPSASPSASASGTPQALVEFSVDGAGPYQLGTSFAALQAAGLLDEVTTSAEVCPGNTSARGTGTWHDIRLSFRKDGALYLTVNRSTSIPTPSGAWLGTTLTELKKIYAAIPGQVLTRGGSSAYLVTTLSGRGILFDLDSSSRVLSMAAGDSAYLKASYQGGTDFC